MFCCRGKRLANYLIENGSPLKRIDKDKDNNKFLVFFFEKNDKLNENLHNWKEDKATYMLNKAHDTNELEKESDSCDSK